MKNNNGEYVNTKEAKEILRVTADTLRRWDKEGKINTIRTPSGIRLYDKCSIFKILGKTYNSIERKKIAYCRVSSRKQYDDLQRQKDFFKSNYPDYELVEDIGSGINFKRKGLQTILEQSMHGKVQEVMVAHKDRLCRFAFDLIKWVLLQNNTKLVVLNQDNNKSNSEELTEDVLSIIHVFSCREMGKRRYKSEKDKIETNCITKENT
jgi:predicted site-specific integrase-resolvase